MDAKEKKSMLCPNCRKLISSDESACPYCGMSNPGSRLKSWFSNPFSKGSLDIITTIIYINVGLYILSLLLNPSSLGLSANPMTFLSPSDKSLFLLGATGTVPIAGFGRWWTLISASFLHGSILHILFNMLALKQLGPFVLSEFGFSRFIVIYILAGVVGFFLSFLAGIPFTIGASASICGLIGAILYYGKSRGGFYGEMIYKQAIGWIVGIVLFGILIPGINNWAHGGGIFSGILLAFLLGYRENKSEQFLHRALAMCCMILTIASFLWAVLQTIYIQYLSFLP